jgi:hypothetical protein
MIRLFILLAALFAPLPVLALSCAPYGPVDAYLDAAASDQAYVVVEGTLTFSPGDLPKGGITAEGDQPRDVVFPASVTGFSLTRDGFKARFVRTVRVRALCYGPWCATLQSGSRYLMFLEKHGAGYELEVNPCIGFAHSDPAPEDLDRVHACFIGKPCVPDPR